MLLDTDVMVDVLRGHPPTIAWLKGLGNAPVGLPGLVAMELLQGCQDSTQQQQLDTHLRRFGLQWPSLADCQRAYQDFAAYHLSHNLGLLDALICATAAGVSEPLATFDVKHYKVIAGLQTLQPY